MIINWLEVFGTAASIIVAISLMMRNIKRLRILNTVGSLAFTGYGILIGSLPVAVLNGFIVLVNIWFLYRMRATRDRFDLLERAVFESPYVELFLQFYKADIRRYQPEFDPQPGDGWKSDLVLRDMQPVSLIVYRQVDEATLEIGLDYAVPRYRDYQSARYYFHRVAERLAAGRSITLLQHSARPEHQAYLRRLGFVADPVSGVASGSDAGSNQLLTFRKVLAPSI
ncbi:MAG: hypothetical protein A2087_06545 [Spirochaetes bacterium GWD1_61_31]|nr:MAG: hypothetical protein A2Y37_08925 [Spirochaetes bacterium GWB1_60_80]OHD31894.1 MAG: hypothetical protein A2004_10310 [Spirochaetes bacterium GWC1_61_12]OHD40009.1 MAG: hypothetical protein A2087_06545 [Spirochaetes bacterium GWD1_61_31]OHD42337.1 MAG: hypothetical protein A2Y35_11455 [Spirochaetes bacterium GWE1_60_18]OHD60509.1 MAG: hypothetical protein A2Y32_03670 [Spirochaetes bacterium GWF1_60_12]HAW86947.1 hypothetical protein [Spirochaetaceae bacterium]